MKTLTTKPFYYAAAILAALAFVIVPAMTLFADHDPFEGEPKNEITICHFNNGGGGSYNSNTVSISSSGAPQGGHDQHSEDIIPPYHWEDGEGRIHSYAGKNWDAQNEDIWNNGNCDGNGVVEEDPKADLSVTKTADLGAEETVFEGDEVVYTITVTNDGPDEATGIIVDDNLPSGVTYLSDDSGGSYDETTGVWTVGTLGDGDSTTLNITVEVNEETGGDEITNEASIEETDATDENDSNDTSSAMFTVEEETVQCTVTITSDETNTVVEKGGDDAKLLSSIHDAWNAVINGADWIWGDDPVADPEVEETQTFVKKFGWNGPVTSATLKVASDNTHSFDLNGTTDGDSDENNYQAGTQDSYDVSGAIQQGNNTLSVAVTNLAREGHTAEQNPAGLLYKLTITGSAEECDVPYEEEEPEEDPWCSFEGEVIDHTPDNEAKQNDGDPVDTDRRDIGGIEDGPAPYANFGGSEGNDWSTDDFFSLGIGGFVIYEFTDQVAFDQSGDDIAIYETTGGTADTDEKAEVFVSQYGVVWTSLGTHTGDMSFDISSAGLDYVKYVKLVDKSEGVQGNNGDGYDVDAIVILEGSCGDEPAVQCEPGKELLENGGFENPTVTHNAQWNIFESGHSGLAWVVEWFGGNTSHGDATRPENGWMELQKDGLQGWLAASGSEQWTELDADWEGPDSSLNGEPGAVTISQTVGTKVGETYTFSFDFSPRPNTAADQNKVEVLANGTVIGTVGPDATSGNQTEWKNYSFSYVADESVTTFALRDAGEPNDSLGTFVDNASLMCAEEETHTISGMKWNDENGDGERSEGETGIANWEIVVRPMGIEPEETIQVDSSNPNPVTTNTTLTDGRVYLIEAEGTWENTGVSGREVDAEYFADDNWSTPQDMADQSGRDERQLDLVINDQNVDWGSSNDDHLYKTVITGEGESLGLRIFDEDDDPNPPSWYNDNEGNIEVRIYDVTDYVVETDESGEYAVDVEPGAYQVVEVMQDGWIQTAPEGPSYCHIDTQEGDDLTCNFGNKEEDDGGNDNGGGGDPSPEMDTITVGKYEDKDQNGSWGDEPGIVGWDVVVKPQSIDPDETFSVDSTEEAGVMSGVLQDGKVYLVEVEGTYQFDSSNTDRVADAEYYSNNNWSDEGDWGDDNPGDDPRTLDLIIDEQNINWGGYTEDPHLYKTVITGSGESLNFRIFERLSNHYSDNDGLLDVRIYDVTDYVHTTGEGGYVDVEVSEGTYQIVEIMRDGWIQTEPSGPSYCHIDTKEEEEPKCIFGNHNVGEEPDLSEGTADVFVEKTVDGDMGVGGTIVYTIDVENNGPDTATNVVLTDVLPEGVTYVSDNSGGDYSTTTGEWYIGTLSDGPSATETLTITATINEETEGDDIANTATVNSDQDDPNSDNNTDTATFEVEGFVVDTNNGGSNNNEPEINGRGGGGNGPIAGSFGQSAPSAGVVLGASTSGGDNEPEGEVLGATSCQALIHTYIRRGQNNNETDVRALQQFLNEEVGANLPITGVYGPLTEAAVNVFQLKYADEVLAPWVPHGLESKRTPTGYVYKTTKRWVNLVHCKELDIPMPQLP